MNEKSFLFRINTKISDLCSRVPNTAYFLLLLVYFIAKAVFFRKNFFVLDTTVWQSQELTMDYSYGFIRRGLIGSFVTLIRNCFNIEYPAAIKTVQNIGFILFAAAILLFFYVLLKNKNEKACCYLVLIYIALDQIGFELNSFGLLDNYIIAITLLMVFLIVKDKLLFFIPFLSGICVMIHEGYPMMFFGVIVALLIYKFCYAEDKKAKQKYATVFVSTGLIVSALFIYFYILHPRIDNPDVEAILASCTERLGTEFKHGTLMNIWLDPVPVSDPEHAVSLMWLNGKPTALFYLYTMLPIFNLIICSPLIVQVVLFWKGIIHNEPSKFKKLLLFICSLPVFLVIPLIIFHLDQARWFYDVIFFEAVVIGGIFLINSNNERNVLSKLTKIGILKILMLLFYCVFFFQLVPGQMGFISLFYIKYFIMA